MASLYKVRRTYDPFCYSNEKLSLQLLLGVPISTCRFSPREHAEHFEIKEIRLPRVPPHCQYISSTLSDETAFTFRERDPKKEKPKDITPPPHYRKKRILAIIYSDIRVSTYRRRLTPSFWADAPKVSNFSSGRAGSFVLRWGVGMRKRTAARI